METILIVEDDIDIHNLITEILKRKNYKILHAYSGTEALLLLEKENIDLILLDLMLPGIEGEQIIERAKDYLIIVISAKTNLEDKVKVLLEGANDYITKPFNNEELLARIKVQLRMKRRENNKLIYKDIKLDRNMHILHINKNQIYLTKTEYAILKQLLLNPKQIITKSKLIELISMDTLDGDENSLKVHISNIRKKIKKVSDKEYIESIWGIGYKMHE